MVYIGVRPYFCLQKLHVKRSKTMKRLNKVCAWAGCAFALFACTSNSYQGKVPPESGQFFKTRMSSEIFVGDCRQDSALCKMISTALQGVVNQDSAEVYLFLGNHHVDQLDDTGRPYTVLPHSAGVGASGLFSLIDNYSDRFLHIYIWTPEEDWTWNMALMLSARYRGMPLTREIAELVIARTDWQGKVIDLTGRWQSKKAAYDWAITELMPGCHRNVLFSVGLRNDWHGAPWTLYDYTTASKGFAFWLDDRDEKEQQVIREICRAGAYKPGSIVMGYAKSGDDLLSTVNNYGIGYVVSDYYANGSFWCAYPNRSFYQPEGKAKDVQPGKIYVSIIFSDGDNLQFDQNALYEMWANDTLRGEVPVGTTMAAGLQEINPFLLEWFYKHKSDNDELVAGPSGYQFIYGRDYQPEGYETWLENNRRWLNAAGFHTACFWHATYGTECFDRFIETAGLQGIFDGDDKVGIAYKDGVIIMNQGEHICREGEMYNALIRLTPDETAPVFVNLYPIAAEYGRGGGIAKLKREIDRLEAERPGVYEYMLPKDLAASAARYFERNSKK